MTTDYEPLVNSASQDDLPEIPDPNNTSEQVSGACDWDNWKPSKDIHAV